MPTRPVIFSTHSLHPEVTSALKALGELRIANAPNAQSIAEDSAGAEYIVVRANIAPEIIKRENGLRALVRHGAGLDMIPVETCTHAGVLVANVPGVNAVTVAEHAIWSATALLRRFPQVRRDLHADGWETARAHANDGLEVSGRTIGVVGMGNVGRQISRIAAHGFDMNVLATTRNPKDVPGNAVPVALNELLDRSDVVVLCCPLNKETRGMIGPRELARMKPDSVLINVSRGPVVNQAALAEHLSQGKIRGAALDVFDEHPLPPNDPLMQLQNVILTPHMAGITSESMFRMGQGVVKEISRMIAGDLPENFVNPDALEHYRKRFATV